MKYRYKENIKNYILLLILIFCISAISLRVYFKANSFRIEVINALNNAIGESFLRKDDLIFVKKIKIKDLYNAENYYKLIFLNKEIEKYVRKRIFEINDFDFAIDEGIIVYLKDESVANKTYENIHNFSIFHNSQLYMLDMIPTKDKVVLSFGQINSLMKSYSLYNAYLDSLDFKVRDFLSKRVEMNNYFFRIKSKAKKYECDLIYDNIKSKTYQSSSSNYEIYAKYVFNDENIEQRSKRYSWWINGEGRDYIDDIIENRLIK